MSYRLIYEDKDGYCRIIVADPHFKQPKESDESALGRLYSIAIPGVAHFIVCGPEDLPQDLTFRDAWKQGDAQSPIKIDFEKALEIHRGRLKQAAEKKIAELNMDLEKAIENQNLPQQVSLNATKRILRNIHEMNLTHCKTPEDLKKAVPKELYDVWTFYPI